MKTCHFVYKVCYLDLISTERVNRNLYAGPCKCPAFPEVFIEGTIYNVICSNHFFVNFRPGLFSVLKERYKREKKLFTLSLFTKLMSSTVERRASWLSFRVHKTSLCLLFFLPFK